MSDDQSVDLSRRKLLGAAGTVGVAGALGGAATSSLLWDEEKFGNLTAPNLFQGGRLDLKVDWEVRYYDGIDASPRIIADGDPTDQPGPIVTLTDLKPGDVVEKTLSARILGNPAFLGTHLSIHSDTDETIPEAEDKVDGHTPNLRDGTDGGDLAEAINCVLWYDGDSGDPDSPGDNLPTEIWTGEATPSHDNDEYLEELSNTQDPDSVFDTTHDRVIATGTLDELSCLVATLDPSVDGVVADEFPDTLCFDTDHTQYIGCLCWLPRDIPGVNDNIIQTDRIEYQFGFSAIQCRHNIGNDGSPISQGIRQADAEDNAQFIDCPDSDGPEPPDEPDEPDEPVPITDTPVGISDHYKVLADQTTSISAPGFLTNDTDPEGESLTVIAIKENVDHGALTAFADGSFSYTPDPGFIGMDSFVYAMEDASGNLSADITVTLEVLEGNRSPIGTDDHYVALADTTLSIPAPGFLGNDVDPDGEGLSATSITENVDNGALTAFADGSFNYTPDPVFTGTDSFSYRMQDESGNLSEETTVTLEIITGNRDPIGTDDNYVVFEDTTLNVAAPGILGNDVDLDGESLTATAITDNVDNGALTVFADGSFNYTPDPVFTGTDSFSYRMQDESGNLSGEITVSIEVLSSENGDPIGTPDQYKVLADQTTSISAPGILANDGDPDGEALTATAITDNVDNGALTAFADGSFNYTPDPGFTGTDSFSYRMQDESGNLSGEIPVTLEVVTGNRDPVGTSDQYTVLADQTTSITAPGILANDGDPDGEALTATAITDNVDNGALTVFADGSFSYTPDPGFTGPDSFSYRMQDESGNLSGEITVTLDVLTGNRDPLGTDDDFAVFQGTSLSISAPGFLANDVDPDGEGLTATAITDNVDNGALVAFADGSFNYTPDPEFTGTDSFSYRMQDASGNLSEETTVTIEVFLS